MDVITNATDTEHGSSTTSVEIAISASVVIGVCLIIGGIIFSVWSKHF